MSIQFLTSKVIHTNILLICLYRYASRQQTHYSMLIGILSAILPAIIIILGYITPSNTLHLSLSIMLMILLSYIGYHMVQSSKQTLDKQFKLDISLILLCPVYLVKQTLDSVPKSMIDEPWEVIVAHLISSLVLAVVFSMTMWYAAPWCQQCVYSIMIYWTAAIQCAEWIGYLELIHNPSYASLIFIIRSNATPTHRLG
ncbi:hypothetical protein A0J61_10494 [Choanephora cucurbitarum]|uniref:Uncharacterized protein n=1 Tax=Choanephora cucurbitarum TaxID=101091 RepID=A0A1C7MX97_9FUNG|nr:hypothetical protein A0J61_10494 [Choanephora cucurbitarum]